MHIELVDSLRCPHPHEDTWLVASVTRFEGRDIVEGSLGCPVCRRQYAVREGEVDFTVSVAPGGDALPPAAAAGTAARPGETQQAAAFTLVPDEEVFLRARALLALGEPGGIVLLGGAHARNADAFEDEVQVTTLLLNAPAGLRPSGRYPSAMRATDTVPVAGGGLRGAWLDRDTATPAIMAAAARALRRGGRLVAPVEVMLPAGVRELARDRSEWVAEGEGGMSAPVAIRRR